jgi:hypothetical protein
MESIHLDGADDVVRAARVIASAADTMSSAALSIDGAFERQQRFLDDWLTRFERVVASMHPEPAPSEPAPASIDVEAPDPAAWQEWFGGFPPCEGFVHVWAMTREGKIARGMASHLDWRQYQVERPRDIMKWQRDRYRLEPIEVSGRRPWKTMNIGESFEVELEQSEASSAAHAAGKRHGRKFSTETLGPTRCRITRTA